MAEPRIGLGTKILIGMVVGAALGLALGERVTIIEPVGDLFIRLLMMAAVPLVFFNLLAGLTTLTDMRAFGRLAGKIVTFYFATTIAAVFLGLASMMLLRPGLGVPLDDAVERDLVAAPSVGDVLIDLVPTNVFAAFAEGNVMQLVVFAALLGIATLFLAEGPRDRLRELFVDFAALFRKLVILILVVAPYGIGALMAVAVGRYGAELFGPMATFVAGVWGAQLVMAASYMVMLRFMSDWRPSAFLKKTGPIWATTVATTSSLASLSVALEVAEEMKLPRTVYSFTLPLGAQINKDGTAVMLAAVLLLTAQAAGVTLSGSEIFSLILMVFLFAAGSGGIPGGGLVVALILVESFGLPLGLAAILGGIYRLVDMGNTTVNIMGDMVGTVIVARSESTAATEEEVA